MLEFEYRTSLVGKILSTTVFVEKTFVDIISLYNIVSKKHKLRNLSIERNFDLVKHTSRKLFY